jgi:hypothetical protein
MLAKTRGHTVENGGVYIYDNTREASKCSEQDRNLMRPFGFERLVISGAAHPYVRWHFALRRSGQIWPKLVRTFPEPALRQSINCSGTMRRSSRLSPWLRVSLRLAAKVLGRTG